MPAAAAWLLVGLCLTALPLAGPAWIAVAAYGCCYGAMELASRPFLAPPGRRWQVPQTMLIGAPPRRRVLVWGAILGPGFATRNPYAGFGLLPLAVAAMNGIRYGIALAVAVGLAHGTARALALLRDVGEVRAAGTAHLDLLLRTVYWRRLDGWLLLTAAALAIGHLIR